MEGSRFVKRARSSRAYAARRYAYVVQPPSPTRRVARRRRDDSPPSSGVSRRRLVSPTSSPRGVRRVRSPMMGGSPDPDDDPVAVNILAALPRSIPRRERMNYDLLYSGVIGSGASAWDVPVPSVVGIARGTGYSQRATSYIRVNRLAFKIHARVSAGGLPFVSTIPGIPDSISKFNAMYFRFAVIYDKQSDGVSPKVTYPDVFATGPSYALNQFRLPATTERYEVLHDQVYCWRDGELTAGAFEVGGTSEPFWYQTGLLANEEIFVECDKLVHYKSDGSTFADIASGNIFYMVCCVGGRDPDIYVNSRTTYSDNI